MSIIISPIITNAGLGVFTPSATGIEFTFTHVAVGTGTSTATAAATALENEIARFPIAGGGIVTGGQAVYINALITNHASANPQDYDITEFGFYGLDGNSNTVLFAIYRTNTTIVSKASGADISAPFVMGLAALPTNNMTVLIDTNASAMLALLGQHTAANHPHTQYKRTLDNTERLKIADAVDNDEAVSKTQLDVVNSNSFNVFGLVYAQVPNGTQLIIPPRAVYRIAVIGGGGGAAGYETGHGGDGTDSYLETSGAELCRAFGGLGGLQGYGTGSTPSPKNEPDRERSGVSFNPLWSSIIIATSKNDSELVALAGYNGFGNGGGVDRTGTDGVANTKGAGNAGAAGCLEFIIKNTSNINDLVIDVVVGVGGTKTSAGGTNGFDGAVAVLFKL